MKRKHKSYSKPKTPFNKARIDEEKIIKKDFGLKNKMEIWKADAKIKSIREKAKKLISANPEEQQALFDRLKKKGFKIESIADILSLDKKDYLERRLQTIVVRKNLATTPKGARQLITHRKVLIDGKAVDSPSYLVPVELEDKITLKKSSKKPVKKEEPKGESKTEEVNQEESKDE